MKASNANKVVSVLLSVAMCPMMVPSAAFAADDDAASGASSPIGQAQSADQAEASGTSTSSSDTIAPQSEAADASTGEAAPAATATVNGYSTLEEAAQKATVDAQGVITYEVTGKVNVDSTGWVQVRPTAATNAKVVKFVGKSTDAEICITQGTAILADQGSSALSVEFSDLKLSKLNPTYAGDYGHSTNYFTTWLRNADAASNCVTYTNCEFPNGVCNNQYGKTVFDNCTFTNTAKGLYNMWVYGGNVEVKGGSFTGVRGVKVFTEGTATVAPKVAIEGTSFTGLTEKAAIVVSKPAAVTLSNVSATDCANGLIQKDIEGSSEKVTLNANGTGIGGSFDITANTGSDASKAEFNLNAGTLTTEVSSDYLADGFTLSNNGDGTYGVAEAAPAAVAEVGGTVYTSLQAAIDAAQAGETVQLLADAVVDDTVIVRDKGAITLDLNGKTISNTKEIWNDKTGHWSLISVRGNSDLTITGNGAIDALASDSYAIDLYDAASKCTIENGAFTGNISAVYIMEGALTINDGTFDIKQLSSGQDGRRFTINCYDSSYKNGTAQVSINGGTFNGFDPANNLAEGTGTAFTAPGYTSVANADGTYGVVAGVAQIGTKAYASLAEAVAAAEDGQTVTLLGDVEQNSQLTIDKSITLDLKGKTIKNTVDIWSKNANAILSIKGGAAVTITGNGTIDAKENDCYTINMVDGDLTIENGTFYGNVSVVQVQEGTLSVKGGTFDLHQKWKGSSKYLINCIDDAYVDGSANVAISGGTFVGFDPNVSPEQKVDGKTPSFAASGVGITKNEDGSFTAAADMTAQVLDKDGNSVKAYGTLADAVAAAEDGQTVRLLADVTLDAQIATDKAITIDGQSRYAIKAAEKLVGADGKAGMFYRTTSAQGTLTFLNVKLDGAGVSKIFLNEGGAGETVFDGVTSINGGGISYGSGIHISGGGSHATIRNSALTGSTGTMELNETNYYAANDLWVGGNVYVTVENSVIGNVFVNSAPSATATNGVVHGQLTITGADTKITYLSGEEESTDKLDKLGNNGSLVKIDSGNVETIFDKGSYAISGGTFKTEVKEEWCAAGYIPTTNSDSTYSVKEGAFVAKVDNVKYDSLQEAIDAAKNGSTVRLLADVALTETAVFPANKTVHINLWGHNITATGTALRINGKTDIQSTGGAGTIESMGKVAVEVGDNAKVTVYSGTLKGREGAVVTGASTGATIEVRGSKATLVATDNAVIADNGSNREGKPNTILVKGGTLIGGIESTGYIACGIYAPWNDNITVSGGTFNITNGAGIVARAGTVKVTGGTFNCTGDGTGWVGDNKNQIPCAALVFDKAANYPALTNDSQILVSGGTFSTDPAANGATLANGYGATKNDDGMYKVAKLQPVAAIGDVKYDTLGQAITAAQDTAGGATITLLKSIETSSYYEVKGDNPVTIDLNGFNITGSGISGLFYVTASGDLTITGEGAVTAVEDNGAAMAVWVRSPKAKVTLAGGTYKQQISNTEDTHFDLIYVERGTAEITGGKYEAYTPEWTLNCKDEHYKSGEAKITVTGGTFNSFDPANNTAEGAGTSFVPTDYISTDNGDGTYSVEEGKFTVQVTSRTTTSDSPVANVSGGGSDITYAEGTTVAASAISGYKFVGWFVNEYAGKPYSTDLTCTVKPTDNCTMIAVYEPVSGGKFWLTVMASEFTVNGGAVQDSYLYEQYAIGASVTVSFTGSENFLYWVNASNKVVSTDKNYTFTMGSETALKAVYGKARQNQATVVFVSHSDQIISSKAYTTSNTIQFPVPPIKMGCTFTGWSMTESEIREAMANNNGIIQVRALYTEPSIDCAVTVVYPDGTDNEVVNAKVGELVNVTAKDIEGKTFSCWTDNDGNVLGYTKTLKLAPSGNMTVKAIYSDGATEAKPVISMTAVDANAGNGYYLISFTATRAVPEGYELVKQGVLYSIDSRCAGDAGKDYLKLTADGTVPEGVYESIGSNNDLNGVTRVNCKVRTADTTLYGRGYMILKNSAGEVLYVYTDGILSGSYNSLNNGGN